MRYLLIVTVLFMFGCVQNLQLQKVVVPKDQQAFVKAFDLVTAEQSIEPLQQFISDYPESEWSIRAADVVALWNRSLELQHKNDVLEAGKQKLSDSLADSASEISELEEKIEQFKSNLIQLEQRPQ